MVKYVIKIHRKLNSFEYKVNHISNTEYCKNHFDKNRIFHVNIKKCCQKYFVQSSRYTFIVPKYMKCSETDF